MSLKEYAKKRDFNKTAEPSAGRPLKSSGRRFVVQKHDASRLHYDLRLAFAGKLRSWAVPKLPTPREETFSCQVEIINFLH
jgi:bifunctional non-homologous end joining protein LigD